MSYRKTPTNGYKFSVQSNNLRLGTCALASSKEDERCTCIELGDAGKGDNVIGLTRVRRLAAHHATQHRHARRKAPLMRGKKKLFDAPQDSSHDTIIECGERALLRLAFGRSAATLDDDQHDASLTTTTTSKPSFIWCNGQECTVASWAEARACQCGLRLPGSKAPPKLSDSERGKGRGESCILATVTNNKRRRKV